MSSKISDVYPRAAFPSFTDKPNCILWIKKHELGYMFNRVDAYPCWIKRKLTYWFFGFEWERIYQ